MPRSCGDVFTDSGFIMKFVELLYLLIFILVLAGSYAEDLFSGHTLSIAGEYLLFMGMAQIAPIIAMFVCYIAHDFDDHLYKVIVLAFGAAEAIIAGLIYILIYVIGGGDGERTYKKEDNKTAAADYIYWDSYVGNNTLNIVAGIMSIILGVLYIIDCVLGGKKM